MDTFNPLLPFVTTDAAFSLAFGSGLGNILGTTFDAVQAPFSAALCVWIIIQGVLVMRGDLSVRATVVRVVRAASVYGLVFSTTAYTTYVTDFFTQVVPGFVEQEVVGANLPVIGTIPLECDLILATVEADFEQIGASISATNNIDSSSYQLARTILYGTLFLVFALYEAASIFTTILVGIGPIFILCYLFDATRNFAERWIGQLVNYAILLILVFIVGTVVLATEYGYLTTNAALLLIMSNGQPTAGQIDYFWSLDIFLLMGDFLVLGIPAVAAAISGGVLQSRGETGSGAGGLGSTSRMSGYAPAAAARPF